MPVKHSEVGRLFPVTYMLGFAEIEDNCYPVFIVLSNWPLVCWGRVGPDSSVSILGVFGRFKVGDRDEGFREWWVIVFVGLDATFLYVKAARLYVNFLAYDFIDVFDWGLRLWSRLVFVAIFNSRCLSEFKAFVGVVESPFVCVLLGMKVWSTLLGMFGSCRFCEFDFGSGVGFEGHSASKTGEDWRYLRRVFIRLGSEIFLDVVVKFGTVAAESIRRHLNLL